MHVHTCLGMFGKHMKFCRYVLRSITHSRNILSITHSRNISCTLQKRQHVQSHARQRQLEEPEPSYDRQQNSVGELIVTLKKPFLCQYGGILPELDVAYEAWGNLNAKKDNVILVVHGLSASAHARSHLEFQDSSPGWWENFIGPDLAVDTNKFYVICVNLLGSCYGSTGPSSLNPGTGKPYGGDFPIVSIGDMVKSQFKLLELLGVKKVHAVVGASLGGLASFLAAAEFPGKIGRVVSISAGGSATPSAIAFRYLQRVALMSDPKWNSGNYYESGLPVDGTGLARKIATVTYRSGPEWDQRFKTMKINDPSVSLPRYHGAEFMIEDYIKHQGDSFMLRTKYDPNSLIYLSKAMDIFDMSEGHDSMEDGFSRVTCPTLVMGASSDILCPATKQEEAARYIAQAGNREVTLKITEGHFGHDTFLLDVSGMGKHMKEFLEA